MKTYAVHTKRVETQDLRDMLAIYPTPAQYGDLYLFAQPHNNPTQPVVDLQHIDDLDEFDTVYNTMLAQEHSGQWVHINEAQGRFVLNKYFPPPIDDVVV